MRLACGRTNLGLPKNFHAVISLPHMAQPIFHSSIEGAQHGAKSLPDFLDYAKRSGASGAQPSNYMLQGGKLFKSAKEIKDTFAKRGMTLDGISAHCPFGSTRAPGRGRA